MTGSAPTPVVHRIYSEDHALWIVVTRTHDVDLARTTALAEALSSPRGGLFDLDDDTWGDEHLVGQERAVELLKQSPNRIGYGRFEVGFDDGGEPRGGLWNHGYTKDDRGVTPFVEWQLEVEW
ncbi:hypothetical protein [Curtobacterium oceanosedimentum]|uniref:hypothetical protein n=1 Tax=Curtobacterium oceanosedimentum TaxID=465820 RepID=UPI00339A9A30